MAQISSQFIPVSHLTAKTRMPGFHVVWTHQCERCDRQCEASKQKEISVCSYGVNFVQATPALLLFGFVLRGETQTAASVKAFKQNPSSVTDRKTIERTLEILRRDSEDFENTRERLLMDVVQDYKKEAMYRIDLLETLKPEIRKSLAFLHDYKQFVARVRQHINVVFQHRYPNLALDSQLTLALESEKSIYWTAVLMEQRLNNTLLLTQPERLALAPRTQLRVHGFISKILRIYQVAFDEKKIRVVTHGQSFGFITAPENFSVVPHALLDNALKYSLRGSQVTIDFVETAQTIEFSVTSFGPKIEVNEGQRIFEIFQRGSAGVAQQEEGSGLGLFLAQFVAKDLGTEIMFQQSPQKMMMGFETKFWINLRRTA